MDAVRACWQPTITFQSEPCVSLIPSDKIQQSYFRWRQGKQDSGFLTPAWRVVARSSSIPRCSCILCTVTDLNERYDVLSSTSKESPKIRTTLQNGGDGRQAGPRPRQIRGGKGVRAELSRRSRRRYGSLSLAQSFSGSGDDVSSYIGNKRAMALHVGHEDTVRGACRRRCCQACLLTRSDRFCWYSVQNQPRS